MKRLTKMFKGGQKGFTLIELLIVIVILGVLAAAIIPNLSRFMGSGTLGAANAELASVRTGIAAYQADNNGCSPVQAASPGGTSDARTYGALVACSALDSATVYFVKADLIQTYITGTTVKGIYNYTIGTGTLAGVNDSYESGIDWDATNADWIRP